MQELIEPGDSNHSDPQLFKAACFLIETTERISIKEALPLAEQLRRAAIKHRISTEHSESIVGKTVDGVPLEGHTHAHYFATDEDGDLMLDHLTVYASRGFDEGDVEAMMGINSIWLPWRNLRVRVRLLGIGVPSSFDANIFRSSRRWRSVTPFSLPRFATRGAGKPPRLRDLPEAQLQRELRSRGLPEAASIKRVEGYEAASRPLVRWLDFHTRRFKGEEGHGLAGFEIEFAEPVRGPIALGFACHFSLGLFFPA